MERRGRNLRSVESKISVEGGFERLKLVSTGEVEAERQSLKVIGINKLGNAFVWFEKYFLQIRI